MIIPQTGVARATLFSQQHKVDMAMEALETTPFIDWQNIFFSFISKKIIKPLMKVAFQKNDNFRRTESNFAVYEITQDDKLV